MWSDNKKVDYLVNALIFLVAINFMHYGQLFLPVICLILFIDNKFKFKVNNIKIFVVLCLFAISFCYFSYDLGFYCVMGFTLPMAYYIGSSLKDANENNVKKLIYIIAFGMVSHIILNFYYDLKIYGYDVVNHQSRYDFWLKDKVSQTGTATNYVLIIGAIYYLLVYERKKIKIIGLILFVISFAYNVLLGRRTPMLMLIIVLTFSFFIDSKNKKQICRILLLMLLFCVLCMIYDYIMKVFNLKSVFSHSFLLLKFKSEGLSSGRLEILIKSIKYLPKYIFGGKKISLEIGEQIHNLWLDVYDYSGAIPFLLITIYTIYSLLSMFGIYKESKIGFKTKLLLFDVYLCFMMQFALEPIMTGASLVIILFIVILSSVETLLKNCKN